MELNLRGTLIQPTDAGYDEARQVYNGMIDKRPAMIARCADSDDVIATVNYARERGMLTSIRGGGHNAGGLGLCDDGLTIDLSTMRDVQVDPAKRTVRVSGGCTWGDVDRTTHAHGMATPSGVISTTGVGGLTLGGGLGHLTRKCGLTIDNLLEADVVLADGTAVTASERENPDLFWALRGGGGNFGVVTSFLFRLHPIHTIVGGPMLWELDDAEAVMKRYREFLPAAPDDVNGFFAFLTVPPGPPFPEELHLKKMCGIVWCYTGPEEGASRAMQPMRDAAPPAFEFVGPMPHPMLQGMFDALYPKGLQWYWKADFVKEISDEAVGLNIEHGAKLPTMHSTMHMYPIDGAASRVGPDETAWAYRDAHWAQVMVGVDPDPAKRDEISTWAREYWEDLHPHSAGGAYVNFMMEEGQDRVRATYKHNYGRLAEVKAKYDPSNFFRVNQNIRPAAAAAAG